LPKLGLQFIILKVVNTAIKTTGTQHRAHTSARRISEALSSEYRWK